VGIGGELAVDERTAGARDRVRYGIVTWTDRGEKWAEVRRKPSRPSAPSLAVFAPRCASLKARIYWFTHAGWWLR
jgi:hypothetical protein